MNTLLNTLNNTIRTSAQNNTQTTSVKFSLYMTNIEIINASKNLDKNVVLEFELNG